MFSGKTPCSLGALLVSAWEPASKLGPLRL
jgi:hypothetical protein